MNQKEEQILSAATGLFLRYGFRRTTMGEVAKEVKISRQTLYEVYSNKEKLLGGVIELYYEKLFKTLKIEWEQSKDLSAKLDVFFQNAVIEAYRLIQQWPDAEDIISEENVHAQNAYEAGLDQLTNLMEKILTPYKKQVKQSGQTIPQYANFITLTSMKLKKNLNSEEELVLLLKSLKISILAVLEK